MRANGDDDDELNERDELQDFCNRSILSYKA